jgi:hypothetical protein
MVAHCVEILGAHVATPNENKISYRWLRPSIAAGSNKEVITKVSYGAASGWLHRLG